MGRERVKLAWIDREATRKATYRKRKAGLFKKLFELSTLCDVKGCAVLYSPDEASPGVWSSTGDVRQVLLEFRTATELERRHKMQDHENFLLLQIKKTEQQLQRLQKENREREKLLLLAWVLDGSRKIEEFSIEEVVSLGSLVESMLKALDERIEVLNAQQARESAAVEKPAAAAQEVMLNPSWTMEMLGVKPYQAQVPGGPMKENSDGKFPME